MALKICLTCPAPPRSHQGNRITALRWARILRALGHRVHIAYDGRVTDAAVLVALHARRSAAAVRAFHTRHPTGAVIVALTGTDLYRDMSRSRAAARSLTLADRLIVLQPAARGKLPTVVRRKTRVIYQSVSDR